MLTKKALLFAASTFAATAALWTSSTATPTPAPISRRYEVTVTNVTRAQVFAPTLVATHDASTTLFELGGTASAGLALLAEEGNPSMLAAELSADPGVQFVADSGGVLMPGQSVTLTVVADAQHPFISMAGMLVQTNDGFFALRDVVTPTSETSQFARVYDAGSEFNSGDCAFIPGPPCGSGGAHDPAPAEGYIRIHEGVHGNGSLAPEIYDWRGEAAAVTIRRL